MIAAPPCLNSGRGALSVEVMQVVQSDLIEIVEEKLAKLESRVLKMELDQF